MRPDTWTGELLDVLTVLSGAKCTSEFEPHLTMDDKIEVLAA
jgi:hypothetical protein